MAKASAVPVLYHIKWHCSSIPYNIALELDLVPSKLEIKTLTPEQLKTDPEYLKISHRQVVPSMILPDGKIIHEVGAIVLYLLETYDIQGKFHPLPGDPERAKYLEAVVYTVAECYHAAMELFHCTAFIPKEKRDKEKVKKGYDRVQKVIFDHLKIELKDGKKEYYLGDTFSAADVLMGYCFVCMIYSDVGILENNPFVEKYFQKVSKREAYQQLYTE